MSHYLMSRKIPQHSDSCLSVLCSNAGFFIVFLPIFNNSLLGFCVQSVWQYLRFIALFCIIVLFCLNDEKSFYNKHEKGKYYKFAEILELSTMTRFNNFLLEFFQLILLTRILCGNPVIGMFITHQQFSETKAWLAAEVSCNSRYEGFPSASCFLLCEMQGKNLTLES